MIFPAILESVKSRKDKSISLNLGTQEMTPQQSAELMSYNQSFLYVMFKPDDISNEEQKVMDSLKSEEDSERPSQSKRMRSVLYLLWKQKSEGYDDFARYYDYKMNKFIESLKIKING